MRIRKAFAQIRLRILIRVIAVDCMSTQYKLRILIGAVSRLSTVRKAVCYHTGRVVERSWCDLGKIKALYDLWAHCKDM